MTSNEQHFKRDAWLSGRHRTWGYNVPAMDIDFLMAEYDNCEPKALIDYKHEHAIIDLTNVGARTLCKLGDMAGIPAFIVRYGHSNQDGWWGDVAADSVPYFEVWPLNLLARLYCESKQIYQTQLTEYEFVKVLYDLRGRQMPKDIEQRLNPNYS